MLGEALDLKLGDMGLNPASDAQTSQLAFLDLSFLISEMGVIFDTTSLCCGDQMKLMREVLCRH